MRLLSVNCGLPRKVDWHGQLVTTSIYKEPVAGRTNLRKLNLDGDQQSDLTVHGGEHKAVYCYPISHYDYWKAELQNNSLPLGIFGENFTIDGLDESVQVGDRFAIGTCEVVVTQPRLPCYKLGIRFGMDDMVKRFLASGRTGFYLAVTREGEVAANDEIVLLDREPESVPVSAITKLYIAKNYGVEDTELVGRALKLQALPDSWKQWLHEKANRRTV
ncbi:MAG: MOSC domain-containing protein [Acidobacteria bacterium]|nr:MOSC domain-containing protein [Acidobacteriota bacterium]